MKRTASGIPGFDKIVGGGLPESDIILLSGECGTGKSVFGMQFLVSAKESGVYVSFEDETDQIRDTARGFGWDLAGLEKAGRLRVLRYDPFRLEDIIDVVEAQIDEVKARRVVLDSVSALGMYTRDIAELRRMILQLELVLRKNRCTSILISEIVPGRGGVSRFGVEEFVTDGVVVMKKHVAGGEFRRGLFVVKMRGTAHSSAVHSYHISGKGISVGAKMKLEK